MLRLPKLEEKEPIERSGGSKDREDDCNATLAPHFSGHSGEVRTQPPRIQRSKRQATAR